MRLSAAQDAYSYEGALRNLSPRNLEWRGQKLARFVSWCEAQGVRDVEAITLPLAHHFLAELPADLSDFTRNGYARVLRSFFNWCAREELLPERIAKKLIIPKVPEKVIDIFTPEQVRRLVAATVHEGSPALVQRDRAILAVLFDTGIRASELCGLTLDSVHFAPQDTYLQVLGKGKRERQVGLGQQARLELHRWVHRYRDASTDEPHVFLNRNGHPLTRNGLDRIIYRCRDYAGLDHFKGVRVSAHTARHTAAVTYLANGGDVYMLSRRLGHTDIQTTTLYLRAMQAKTARQGISVFDSLTRS